MIPEGIRFKAVCYNFTSISSSPSVSVKPNVCLPEIIIKHRRCSMGNSVMVTSIHTYKLKWCTCKHNTILSALLGVSQLALVCGTAGYELQVD